MYVIHWGSHHTMLLIVLLADTHTYTYTHAQTHTHILIYTSHVIGKIDFYKPGLIMLACGWRLPDSKIGTHRFLCKFLL